MVERSCLRAMRRPPTIRAAGRLIVVVTLLTVILAGVAMRIFDHDEFPNVWLGMWWALQTVTTVGYGDIVPTNLSGRLIAAVTMLEGIAFITIVTAAITSTFIERARREHKSEDRADRRSSPRRDVAPIDDRLDRIEQRLSEL